MNTKPRRILIFSLVYYPRFVGGAEVAVKEITDRISPQEIEFDMITLRFDVALPKIEKIGNITIYRVGWAGKQKDSSDSLAWYLNLNKYALPITGFIKAVLLARTNRYDAMWSIMATYNSFAALFFKLCHPKIPFLLTLQEGDPIPYIKRRALLVYPLFKMIFTRATYIQAISRYLADWGKDMNAHCPIDVIPNAVDWKLFSTKLSPEKELALKQSIGKKDGDVMLVHTGRLVVKNAVGDIIAALQYLPPHIKLLLIGQGYEEAQLKDQVAKLGLQDRVIFKGFLYHKDMPQYLHVSDIFIRPSLSEGFGNSFIEAMAAGIPVIATPVGGISDFLIDGETGLFCEVNNPRSIAQKVEKLIKDIESRDYIVGRAKSMVEKIYQWESVVEKMKDIFGSL